MERLRLRAARARERPTEPSRAGGGEGRPPTAASLGTAAPHHGDDGARAAGGANGTASAPKAEAAGARPPPGAPSPSPAMRLGEAGVLALLRRRPKDVPELRSRAAFRAFFGGTPRRAMLRWLMAALQTGADDARVGRRMELLNDVLL